MVDRRPPCPRCGHPLQRYRREYFCEECGHYQAVVARAGNPDYDRAWRQRQVERGLCLSCISPRLPGMVHCQRHREVNNLAHSKMYRLQRKLGICPRCGGAALYGKVHCRTCQQVLQVDAAQTYRARKLAGLCTTRGCSDDPIGGGVLCERHREKATARNREYRKRKREAATMTHLA